METFLSDQQERIIKLLDDGHTWSSAAEELDISQSTLEEQMRRVRVKRERCEATLAWLVERGQLDPGDIDLSQQERNMEPGGWEYTERSDRHQWTKDGQVVTVKEYKGAHIVSITSKPRTAGVAYRQDGYIGASSDDGADWGDIDTAIDIAIQLMEKYETFDKDLIDSMEARAIPDEEPARLPLD